MNQWESDVYGTEEAAARQRELDRKMQETGEQQYMGQGGLGEAYSNMRKLDQAERQRQIDKMLNIVGGVHSVDTIVAKLYDAGYRKK